MRKFVLFLLVALTLSLRPVPQPPALFEDLGVVWSDGGNTLKVLYREYDEYFIREWDFSSHGVEMEYQEVPIEALASFSREAYAVGVSAVMKDGEIFVYSNRSGEGNILIRTVYGHVV